MTRRDFLDALDMALTVAATGLTILIVALCTTIPWSIGIIYMMGWL